jgi:hypothetical protein
MTLAEGRPVGGRNPQRPIRRAREALAAAMDSAARKAFGAPVKVIPRPRGGRRKAEPEEDEGREVWPCGVFA